MPPGGARQMVRRLARRYMASIDGTPTDEEARYEDEVKQLVAELSSKHMHNMVDYMVESEREWTIGWTDEQGVRHTAVMREHVYVVRIRPLEAAVERSGGAERLKCPVCGAVLREYRR